MSSINFQAIIIETSEYRITGKVALPTVGRTRLSDYANDHDRHFFSVVDATLAPLASPESAEKRSFILVARSQILMLSPAVSS